MEECFVFEQEFDNSKLKSWFDIDNTYKQFNLDDPIIEYLEDHRKNHVFYDLVAHYMEGFFSLCFQSCFQYGDQMHHELPSPLHCPIYIW